MELLMALSIRWLLSGANYNFVYFYHNLALGPRFLALFTAVKIVFSSFDSSFFFGLLFPGHNIFWLSAFVEILNCTWGKRVEAHTFNGLLYF